MSMIPMKSRFQFSQFEAQEIPNPVILGGFVNVPNSGDANGRFYINGDADDYFRVVLKAGDTLTLIIGEDLTADTTCT